MVTGRPGYRGPVPDSLRRVTVGCTDRDADRAVDLTLPARTYVGQLLPPIADIVCGDLAAPLRGWRLALIGGPPLDEAMTLEDQDIRDGDHLILTDYAPAPAQWVIVDPAHVVAHVGEQKDTCAALAIAGCVTIAIVSAAGLIWSAATTAGQPVIAAGLAVAFAVGAVAAQRIRSDSTMCVTASAIAVIFAIVAGFVAVPKGAPAAQTLLAASAGLSAAIVLRRLIRCGTTALTAIGTASALIAGIAAAGSAWQLAPDLLGATLATVSLSALAVAPKLAIAATRIGLTDTDAARRGAANAHQTLTGIVLGSSGAAALGTVLVLVESIGGSGPHPAAVLFTAVIGLAFLLRVRTHVVAARRIGLASAGICAIAVCFASALMAAPEQAQWISIAAAVTGAAMLSAAFGLPVSPLARRALEVTEYVVLAAVVPTACWVGGLYGLVRDMGLL
jgi:type VII secretion integral membrane protein EccD